MNVFRFPKTGRNDQRGFVLVTSLIFLVVVTLLAVSAMNSSTIQQRMASNLRDKSHARQDADATLREGETLLHSTIFDTYRPAGACYGPSSPDAGGACDASAHALLIWSEDKMFEGDASVDPSIAFLNPNIWNVANIQRYRVNGADAPVAFFVEEIQSQFHPRDLNPDNAAHAQGRTMYRITARAQGAGAAANAVTQSFYEKRY